MSDSPFGQVKKATPEIDFPGDTPPTDLVVEDLQVGSGAEATAGAQISAHYVGVAWSTGE
ncbi:MAG TPA: FKBP-type peptidyl-prolyl cis-trans isomerase, partial [Ornithinimicrobium sp.]|nr:FKBP-type peptidyl-prolyl cis-trans isomerase [Ornithinimicrobium sp.]